MQLHDLCVRVLDALLAYPAMNITDSNVSLDGICQNMMLHTPGLGLGCLATLNALCMQRPWNRYCICCYLEYKQKFKTFSNLVRAMWLQMGPNTFFIGQ